MIELDDVAGIQRADPADMLGMVAALPDHVRDAYRHGRAAKSLPEAAGVSSIVFCGMGGSAVAGDVLKQAFRDRLALPVDVNRAHGLPASVGPSTLVIVSSYSGETSETLAAFRGALDRGARIFAVTSGGALGRECAARGLPAAIVPPGFQPRAALGHLAFTMLGALEATGILPPIADEVDALVADLRDVLAPLGPEVPAARNEAKDLASWLGDRVPVIWGPEGTGAVAAMRWKTQMNENGKVPAFHASMSELDHNELVGWVEPYAARFAVIALEPAGMHPEIEARFRLSADAVREAGGDVRRVHVGGGSPLATLLSLIAIGDMASCYVALQRGIDPTPVEVIQRLKGALAGGPA